MNVLLRALISATLLILASCSGGGADHPEPAEASISSPHQRGSAQSKAPRNARKTSSFWVPASIVIDHYEARDVDGCNGEKFSFSGASSGEVASQYYLAIKESCDYGAPFYEAPKEYDQRPGFIGEDTYIVVGNPIATGIDVQWFDGGVHDSFGSAPYGTVACPAGYTPSDLYRFQNINSGIWPLETFPLKCNYDSAVFVPEKNRGVPDHCPVGDPINQATGNNFQIEKDFEASGFEMFLERTYNSQGGGGYFGAGWTSHLDRRIIIPTDVGGTALVVRPHGEIITFVEKETVGSILYFGSPSDIRDGLQKDFDSDGHVNGWKYFTDDDSVERYDPTGRLVSVTARSGQSFTIHYKLSGKLDYAEDNFGQRMTFVQDSRMRVTEVKDPAQRVYKYAYDGDDNLTTVTYPDTKYIRHIYNEAAYTSGVSQPHAMTGIKDEKGIRFATITYAANGMAVASEHALHTEKTKVDYTIEDEAVTEAKVTFGTAKPATYKMSVEGGTVRSTSADRPCVANPTAKEIEWTYRGQVGYVKDFLNHERYSYFDGRDNEYLREEHVEDGKVIQTNFEWHPTWRLVSKLTRGALQVKIDYDPVTSGLASYTISDTEKGKSRTWAYKTDGFGRVTEEDGPRQDVSDITSFTYYQANEAYPGQLKTVTNAAGHTTTFQSYDALGNPLDIQDPNGVVVQLRYDLRYRLQTITRNGQVTRLDYDDVGQLETLTLPSKRAITYSYDNARRLTDIRLNDGEHVHFTPDAEGNVKKGEVYDANNNVVMSYDATFDGLRQVATFTNGHKKTSTILHDLVGNLTDVIGPGSAAINIGYDALNRAKTLTQTDAGTITTTYDIDDGIWRIEDANGNSSKVDRNLLGDVKSVTLPAADGNILSQTPDSAGNVKTRVDFRTITEQRNYDELNRIKSRSVTGSPSIAFTYDEGANAKGHLTGLQDYSGSTKFSYDKNGELSGITRKYDGLTIPVGVGHTNGNITRITYPSGRVVGYGYSNGQLRWAKVDGVEFVTDVRQHPLGKVQGWSWSSGAAYLRTRDNDGLVDSYTLGGTIQTLSYDGTDRLETITDSGNSAYNQTFGHDLAGRVTSYKGLDAKGKNSEQQYFYDLNGNRKTHRFNGSDFTYTYTQGSNYLETVPGPVPRGWVLTGQFGVTDGVNNFSLDAYGRMTGVTNASGSTTYLVNGLNQRVTKVMPNGAKTHFVYGPSGELLAELDKTGHTLKEYIWIPTEADGYPTLTGVSDGANGEINRVYTDQLGTPRLVTGANGDVLWRWVSDPFGAGAPIETGLKLNLRFAGQYFDAEHGYHYNWNRYYDPATGRYTQSDPFGLNGGVNTFVYASGDPLAATDSLGLIDSMSTRIMALAATGDIQGAIFLAETAGGGAALALATRLQQVQAAIQTFTTRYPLATNRCVDVADGIANAAKSANLAPQFLRIAPNGTPFVYIGERYNAFQHFAVRLGDRVYDSLTGAQGMLYSKYVNMLSASNNGPNSFTVEVVKSLENWK